MIRNRTERTERRHKRVRTKVSGTPERPRLCLRKTARHLYAVIVDDTPAEGSRALVAATTNTKTLKAEAKTFCNRKYAKSLAATLVAAAKAKGISQVVFDRGGALYHGVVKQFADACREAGLKF